jgi:GDP-L-fucose synthase
MKNNSKILVLGGNGLLGSAINRILKKQEFEKILSPRRGELNLLEKKEIDDYLKEKKPEYIFMAAGLVGGINANMEYPADFIFQNSIMILNLLESVKKEVPKAKILYPGSTCIYPRENPQPISEERLLSGKLEETNKAYAVAKIMGITACESYHKQYKLETICVQPTNMYGLNDNYDLETGHMIPSLIKRVLLAKENKKKIEAWGSGNPRREALYSEDCADALIFLMKNYNSPEIINIGTGFDYSIKEFIEIIEEEVGYTTHVKWDSSKPDGTFEKRTDIGKLKKIYPQFNSRSFKEGVREILSNKEEIKRILK